MIIHHPASWHQVTEIAIDAGLARDIALMLTDAHALISGIADGDAPAAASQAAGILDDAGSSYDLPGLATALSETVNMLYRAIDDAHAQIPGGH